MSTGERGSSTSLWRVSGVAARRFSELPYARYVLPVPLAGLWSGWHCSQRSAGVAGEPMNQGQRCAA